MQLGVTYANKIVFVLDPGAIDLCQSVHNFKLITVLDIQPVHGVLSYSNLDVLFESANKSRVFLVSNL